MNAPRPDASRPLDAMTPEQEADIEAAAGDRLMLAERSGLKLAIQCRTAVIGIAFAWYLLAVFATGLEVRPAALIALPLLAGLGLAHLSVIGTRYDRRWLKYATYAIDTLAICALFVLIPISRADDIPQIIAFRAYGIHYLFPIVVLASLSLSWKLVLWTGGVAVLGWWAAFFAAIRDTTNPLSWDSIPADATRSDYENIFLSIDFIGRGNRIEETGLLFAAAAILAFAVYRGRRIFLRQIAAERAQLEERAARDHITQALGRYVPQAIAARLAEDGSQLLPQERMASVLVTDIADFSGFAAAHNPSQVIAALDEFLSKQCDTISGYDGVVISFTGDGLLAAFNAPAEVPDHETAAVSAACDLLAHAATTRFDIRIGVATGALAYGSVGSSSRQAFTIYGDTVNRAARLEEYAKTTGQKLLIDAATREGAGDRHTCNRVGATSLRGLNDATEIFAVSAVRQPDPAKTEA